MSEETRATVREEDRKDRVGEAGHPDTPKARTLTPDSDCPVLEEEAREDDYAAERTEYREG